MGHSAQSNSSSLLVRAYEGFILWHFLLTVLGLYLIIRVAGVSKLSSMKEFRTANIGRQFSQALLHH